MDTSVTNGPFIFVPEQEPTGVGCEAQQRRLAGYTSDGMENRRLLLSIVPGTSLNCPGCSGLSQHTLVIVHSLLNPSNFSELYIDYSRQSF